MKFLKVQWIFMFLISFIRIYENLFKRKCQNTKKAPFLVRENS